MAREAECRRGVVSLPAAGALLCLALGLGCGGGEDAVVVGASPVYGNNTGPVTIAITGSGFRAGSAVALTAVGLAEIGAEAVSAQSETQISATFDLSGATTGLRSLVVTDDDGHAATLADAFRVTRPTTLYVGGNYSRAVQVFENADSLSGAGTPSRTVPYPHQLGGIALDTQRHWLYCTAWTQGSVLAWANGTTVNGSVAPTRTIQSTAALERPDRIALDAENDLLYVPSRNTSGISGGINVFHGASTLPSGTHTPARRITGAAVSMPTALFLDGANNRLYVGSGADNDGAIAVLENARSLNGDATPARTISSTVLRRWVAGVAVDPVRNVLYAGFLSGAGANGIAIYRNAATVTGAATPDAVVEINAPISGVWIDSRKDMLFVPINLGSAAGLGTIHVFDNASQLTASSTPTRSITNLKGPMGLWTTSD